VSGLDFLRPPGDDDDAHEPNWTLDLPDGCTEADLARSMIAEQEAILAMVSGPILVRRGEPDDEAEWVDVGDTVRRHRHAADFPEDAA
jgi:hypothetical protein